MRTQYVGTIGDDVFAGTETVRETFYGLGGNDEFQFLVADYSDRFIGGRGNDSLTGLSLSFVNDSSYDTFAGISFDGGVGRDSIVFDIDVPTRAIVALDLDGFSALDLLRSVEVREYNVTSSSLQWVAVTGSKNAEIVNLTLGSVSDGQIDVRLGGGADHLTLAGSYTYGAQMDIKTGAGADVVDISISAIIPYTDVVGPSTIDTGNGDDSVTIGGMVGDTVLTGKGSDMVHVLATATYSAAGAGTTNIVTGGGKDTIVLEGMYSESVRAGGGNDKIYLLTGNFADTPDVVFTGSGRDRIYVELDSHSVVGEIRDFDAAMDKIILDRDELRNTDVVFRQAQWNQDINPNLFMNNKTGQLFYGDNLLLDFGGPTDLTADNFAAGYWDF